MAQHRYCSVGIYYLYFPVLGVVSTTPFYRYFPCARDLLGRFSMAHYQIYIVDIRKLYFSEKDDQTLLSTQNIRLFSRLALLDPII